MIKIINLKMCHDTYIGECQFDGKNVKEVLQEIKEYTNNSKNGKCAKIGEFGNDKNSIGNHWDIIINDKIYISSRSKNSWRKQYQGEYDNCEVESISVSGGWYCAYDFYIKTKENDYTEEYEEEMNK